MSLFSKAHGELSIIFDIGSQNVGVAIMLQKDADKPQIIWTHRENFAGEIEKSPRETLEAMLSTLKKINLTLQKDAVSDLRIKGFHISSALYYALSSPWIEIEQKTIMLAYEKPTTITKKLVEDAIKKEEMSFESSFKNQKGFALVEKAINGFKLNGYGVKDPYGKKASSLEISFAIAITPREICERIEEAVSSKKAKTAACATKISLALEEIFQEKDFLSVIVEDSMTELVIIKDSIPLLHTSFPVGRNGLISDVAQTLRISVTEADSHINLYSKKELDKATTSRIDPIIKKKDDAWSLAFTAATEDIARTSPLPRKAFFIAGENESQSIAHIIKNRDADAPLLESIVVDQSLLKDKIIFGHISHVDTRLGLIGIALSKAQN